MLVQLMAAACGNGVGADGVVGVAGAVSVVVAGGCEGGADGGRVGGVTALRSARTAVWRGTLGRGDGEAAGFGGRHASSRPSPQGQARERRRVPDTFFLPSVFL